MSSHLLIVVALAMAALAAAAPHPAPQSETPLPEGSIDLLPENTALHQITSMDLSQFLKNEDSVAKFTDCFIEPKKCKSRSALNLIRQIRMLGLGGECPKCTMEEQMKLHSIIFEFIMEYMTRYPSYWRRVLPRIGFLL